MNSQNIMNKELCSGAGSYKWTIYEKVLAMQRSVSLNFLAVVQTFHIREGRNED